MKIALGYILTFCWVFLVLGAALLLKRKRGLSDEASRKLVHIFVAFAWIPMAVCFGAAWHALVPPAVFIVLNAVSYKRNLFVAMERSDESKRSLGTVYYAVSMTVMAAWTCFLPELLPCYGAGLFCMALGDGLAPVFGSIRRGNVVIKPFGGRTLYGSICVFFVSFFVVSVFAGLFSTLTMSVGEMALTALAAVALELVGVKGFDNLTLPLGVFLLTFFFSLS